MLQTILVPVSIVTGTGLIAGLLLSIASKFFAVKVDETVANLREVLPGANCGACGCAGCDEYASKMAAGEAPPNPIVIEENGAKFAVDVRHGQKSGFYFDQRDARAFVGRLAAGKRMLNAFSYTGGFGVVAALAGAEHVINIDSSAPALKLAAHNMERNRIRPERYENRENDVFAELRSLSSEGRKFDLVVLDPPKFIDSRNALTRGCRAYQDIARLGFGLLAPGGVLCNFSCSGLMTPELFQKITADAAVEAGVRGVILHRFEQAADHPAALAVPESFYLKGLATRIDA